MSILAWASSDVGSNQEPAVIFVMVSGTEELLLGAFWWKNNLVFPSVSSFLLVGSDWEEEGT